MRNPAIPVRVLNKANVLTGLSCADLSAAVASGRLACQVGDNHISKGTR
jgi:hypothetical protein